VDIVLDDRGDLEARFVVRIKELYECYRLISISRYSSMMRSSNATWIMPKTI
jgi:Ni,Fe-hydrogenase III large subunit